MPLSEERQKESTQFMDKIHGLLYCIDANVYGDRLESKAVLLNDCHEIITCANALLALIDKHYVEDTQ